MTQGMKNISYLFYSVVISKIPQRNITKAYQEHILG